MEKKDDIDTFIKKYCDDFAKLLEIGYIQDDSDDEDYTKTPGEIIYEYSNS